jgi:hypothetical protein
MLDAWLEKMEANWEEKEALEKQRDVPKEYAIVETIEALEDQYGNQHLAIGCRWQPKKRAQGNGGSRQKLAAAQG